MEILKKSSKKNRKFLGVCGGVSKYINNELDPFWVRLFWALSCLLSPFMIILYFILAIALKSEVDV